MPRPSRSQLGIVDPVDAAVLAIADPTRWRLLHLLAVDGSASATMLAARLPVSRPAVARHLQILLGAGLVRAGRRGRAVHFHLRAARLDDASRWLARIAAEWNARTPDDAGGAG